MSTATAVKRVFGPLISCLLALIILAPMAKAQEKLITFEDVKVIAPNAKDEFAQALIDAEDLLEDAGINTRLRMAHFLAQVLTETGGLTRLDENMNYSFESLMSVFSRALVSEGKAREIAGKPQEVANWVYGGRKSLGNGGRHTNDGWDYRGSGYIQLTGRANFRERGIETGLPLEDQPEIARRVPEGLVASVAYWTSRDINSAADDHDRLRVRVLVNGPAAHGYEQSVIWFNKAWLRVFQHKEGLGFESAVELAESTLADEELLFDRILVRGGFLTPDGAGTESVSQESRRDALKSYQRERGLPQTGELDDATEQALLDPMEWRHLPAEDELTNQVQERDGEQTAVIEFSDSPEPAVLEIAPSTGTNEQLADKRLLPKEGAIFSAAIGQYADYEMGGKDVQREFFVPFSVIGDDNREVVMDTTHYPSRAIVQILMKQRRGGKDLLCTGTMISRDTVLTAAHCIHSGTVIGSYFTDYRVIPARNTGRAPYGRCGAKRGYVLSGWTNALSQAEARYYDLGALKLDCNIGERTGWLGVRVLADDQVLMPTRVQGYAADRAPAGRQWVSEDKLAYLWELKGFYQNDTFGGTSGSAVTSVAEPDVIVGVHTNGLHGIMEPWSTHNAFTRITPERITRIIEWMHD